MKTKITVVLASIALIVGLFLITKRDNMGSFDVRVTDASGNVGQARVDTYPFDKPLGPTGTFTTVFSDDFEKLDTSKWVVQDGRDMNGVLSKASNVLVENSLLKLRLSQTGSTVYGAMISSAVDWDASSSGYWMARGDVVEALIRFPGTPTEDVLNWGGFWTSGPNWPQSGENDIAEGGPGLSINYHGVQSVSGNNLSHYVSNGNPTPSSNWKNQWIRATLQRTTDNKSKIWFNGQLMRTIDTSNHELASSLQAVIFSLGKSDGTLALGSAGELQVDWFKAYRPV